MELPIPNFPTDNLYKFKSLAYLFLTVMLFIGGTYLLITYNVVQQSSMLEVHKLKGEIAYQKEIFSLQIHNIEQNLKYIGRHLDDIGQLDSSLEGLKHEHELQPKSQNKSQIDSISKELDKIDDEQKIWHGKLDSLKISTDLHLKTLADTLDSINSKDYLNSYLPYGAITLYLGFFLGLFLTRNNFDKWYSRHQKYLDELLQKSLKFPTLDEAKLLP